MTSIPPDGARRETVPRSVRDDPRGIPLRRIDRCGDRLVPRSGGYDAADQGRTGAGAAGRSHHGGAFALAQISAQYFRRRGQASTWAPLSIWKESPLPLTETLGVTITGYTARRSADADRIGARQAPQVS